jgi:hypothetical protein
MKILYLTEVNLDLNSGVLSKMNEQIDEWVSRQHEVFVASLPTADVQSGKKLLTKNVTKSYSFKNPVAKKYLKGALFNFGNKILSLKQYKAFIDSISPDLIYLREMVGFPGLAYLIKDYKVVVESNTIMKEELKLRGNTLSLLYSLFQNQINKHIDGFIGVTDEIALQYQKFNKPFITIANGIKIDNKVETDLLNTHQRPQIIMVASPGCPWHGVDKYAKLAELLQDMDFHLVGPPAQPGFTKNLTSYGYLDKVSLKNLYLSMDIAVGSLALHRNNMKEACPLKSREYGKIGLPMIFAYKDPDFSGTPFVLELENTETNVMDNIEAIKLFIQKWKGRRVNLNVIEPLISLSIKEEARLTFFKKIIL